MTTYRHRVLWEWKTDNEPIRITMTNREWVKSYYALGAWNTKELLALWFEEVVEDKQKDYKYLVDVVITSIIKTYDEWWFTRKEEDAKKGGHVLIWYRWAVYVLQSDFSVYRSSRWFKALGCWSDYAEWALHLVNNKFDNPRKAIATAILAAHEFCPGAVSRKCDIISL